MGGRKGTNFNFGMLVMKMNMRERERERSQEKTYVKEVGTRNEVTSCSSLFFPSYFLQITNRTKKTTINAFIKPEQAQKENQDQRNIFTTWSQSMQKL